MRDMEREIAWRVFAREYGDSTLLLRSGEERAPAYLVTPTGAKVNRIYAVGTLVSVENKGTEEEPMWIARLNDPTGFFFIFAGQHQRDVGAVLSSLQPPVFLAVTGKVRAYTPPDGDRMYVSVRAEGVHVVEGPQYDDWILDSARSLKERLDAWKILSEDPELGVEGLASHGVGRHIAEGVLLAQEHYGRPNLGWYRDMLVSALQTLLPEYDGLHASHMFPAPQEEGGGGEEVLSRVLEIVRELDEGPQGAIWEDILDRAAESGITPEDLEEAVEILIDRGELYEPVLGRIKLV
ncbi:MAG: hypothetical protein J7L61_02140 [Thermoplasmata archaeon]|nr:hypothetical protein [Thermoplasmata archaeon]